MNTTYASPSRTSGIAVTSLVLGILCLCVSPLAPFALLFGVLALVGISKARGAVGGNGLAVSGVILGSVGCLILVGSFFFIASIGRAARSMKQPITASIPPYETFYGESARGSGFHFEWNGERFIACSKHQFDGATPRSMMHLDFEDSITIIEQAHAFRDVQILRYESSELDEVEPLVYDPDAEIGFGEPMVILFDGRQIVGHMRGTSRGGDGLVSMKLQDETVDLQGSSGAPVVSGKTGTVVGVMIAKDLFLTYFQPLDLPRSLLVGDQADE